MRVSVVVPTYRRPQVLGRCLDALAAQRRPADEVLVVVRREDEESRSLVEERGEDHVRAVAIEVPEGHPGFVAALNAGVAASRGDAVCLTDDDAEPWPDWIAQIVAAFEADPEVGAIGGRDWVYHGDRLEQAAPGPVGVVTWWGRVIGRHHLGVGDRRDVSVLKGVNLSARGEPLRRLGFDRRLRGRTTEHHSELGLCLRLRRLGYRVVYDPAIAVDHRPAPRTAEAREFDPDQVRDAAHNETLALLEHLSPAGVAAHLLWTTAVGSRVAPGLAQALRLRLGDTAAWGALRANVAGRGGAVATHLRSRRGRFSVLTIAHTAGGRTRAEQLFGGSPDATVRGPFPGPAAAARALLRSRAGVLYLVDVGRSTAPLALAGRLLGKKVVVDTGDAGYALARSLGERGFAGLLLVGAGEQLALRSANAVVVRGRAHAAHVPRPATHIPDLPPPGAGPEHSERLARELGLEGAFVVGLVGSLIFSPRRGTSYGWDLIEALPETDPSVLALIVGDGNGLGPLRERARALGVLDRCRFPGRVGAGQVGAYVGAMNLAISTQSNDLVGQVRTTGKLPLYLACGCPVLATDVGEAAALLGPHGWTLPYSGVVDRSYPPRLAAAIEAWRGDPEGEPERRRLALRLAREFEPGPMRARAADLIARVSR